jgi:hypothetical protein
MKVQCAEWQFIRAREVIKADGARGISIPYQGNALHIACRTGKITEVQSLLCRAKNLDHRNMTEFVNARDENGETPLFFACRRSAPHANLLVEELSKSGCDLLARAYDHKTALMHLVLKQNEIGIRLFYNKISHLYSFNNFYVAISAVFLMPKELHEIVYSYYSPWKEYLDSCDANGTNALMMASTKARKMVSVLLELGANPLAWFYEIHFKKYVTVLNAVKLLSSHDAIPIVDSETLIKLEVAVKTSEAVSKPKTVPLNFLNSQG